MRPARFPPPKTADVSASLSACLANGERLLDDAQALEFRDPAPTRFMLAILAQEEFAKAFLLFLVREEIVPWTPELLRVMRNHACKHLVAIVMEYLDPQWETLEELRTIIDAEFALDGAFPPKVADALNILYHEMMERGDFFGENKYDPFVKKIAKGKRDKIKQNAVYISIDRSACVKGQPNKVGLKDANVEFKRAERFGSMIKFLVKDGPIGAEQYRKLKEALKVVYWQREQNRS